MENRCLISTYHFIDIKCANEVYINFLITVGPQNVVEESVLQLQPMSVSKKELDSYTPCKAMALKLSWGRHYQPPFVIFGPLKGCSMMTSQPKNANHVRIYHSRNILTHSPKLTLGSECKPCSRTQSPCVRLG